MPTLSDGWLSGFTDAEGCFYVSIVRPSLGVRPPLSPLGSCPGGRGGVKKAKLTIIGSKNPGEEEEVEKTYTRVRIRFNLDQKDESLLLHIKSLFGFGSVNKTSDPGVFKYSNGSFKANSITVDYFESFPLKTKKQAAFRKWAEIRTILLAKEHLLPGGIERIRKLAKLRLD
jgi:hypothetical protein